MQKRFCISYSCGKDSSLALGRMIAKGHEPVALIVMVNKDVARSWFHGVDSGVLRKVGQCLDIPLIEAVCDGDGYEKAFVSALARAQSMGADACVFGDIDIAEHRAWSEDKCRQTALEAVYPLWRESRAAIVQEFIQKGYKACIKAVSKQHNIPKAYLGRVLSPEIIQEFVDLGIDSCGENGEYHTFCFDGPIFKQPVHFLNAGIHENEYAYSLGIALEDYSLER